jgi:hypothetical protein
MFRKLVTAALLCTALSTSALAQSEAELFFEKKTGVWTIEGRYAHGKVNPVCVTSQWWQDGSAFSVVQNLNNKDFYFVVTNVDWNFSNDPGVETKLQLNATRKGEFYKGMQVIGTVHNKNTLRFMNLSVEAMKLFIEADSFLLIMPDNFPNSRIELSGSSLAFDRILECMKASMKVDLFQNVRPRHPRTTF